MNACDNRISLDKKDWIPTWKISWKITAEVSWKDFYDVMGQVKWILWCGNHSICRNKSECSISRKHSDWERWTLALI
jgi:hypothetical protein